MSRPNQGPETSKTAASPVSLRFELDDLSRPEVVRLLEEHLQEMYATSPADSVHWT